MGCSKHASQQVSFLVRNPQNANLTLLSRSIFHSRRWWLDCNESYIHGFSHVCFEILRKAWTVFFLFNGELTGKLFVRGYVQKNFRGLRPRTPDKLYTFFFNGGLIEYLICDDINHFLIPNVPGAPPRTPDRLIGCMYVFYTDGWLSSKFVIMLLAWVNQNFLVASHPDPRQIISLFFFNGDDIIVSFR